MIRGTVVLSICFLITFSAYYISAPDRDKPKPDPAMLLFRFALVCSMALELFAIITLVAP